MEAAKHKIRINRKNSYIFRVYVKLAAEAAIMLAVLTFFTDKHFFLSAVVPFMGMSFLITIPLLWMGIESSRSFNLIFAGIGITLFLAGQFFLGIPWWFSVLILFLLHWRTTTHLEEERASRFEFNGGFILGFMLLSVLSFAYQSIYHMQPAEIILIVYMCGILIYTGGTFIVRFAESAEHSSKSTRAKSVKLPLLFGLLILILTGVFALLNNTVNNALATLLNGFFWLLSFLIDPIWNLINWLLGLLPEKITQDIEMLKRPEIDMPYEVGREEIESEGSLSFAWWNEALIVLLGIIILIYLWRNYKNKGWNDEESVKNYAGFSSYRDPVKPNDEKPVLKVDYSNANSEIRKSILALESLAAKSGLSRSPGETLQDWFKRVGFQEEKEFYRLYEEVRYGNKKVPPEKVTWFKQCVERLEEKMKED